MPISQAEFARRRNVSRARVSQWIKEGKIHGGALVNGGIDEALACQQLDRNLDIDQRHGNGLRTDLKPRLDAPLPLPDPPAGNNVTDQIAQARLVLLNGQIREKKVAEALQLGVLCENAAARQATGKVVTRVVARVEGALPEFAAAIAAKFKLSQRDVLHELKARWRQVRSDAATEAKERAEPMPETVGFDLGDSVAADDRPADR